MLDAHKLEILILRLRSGQGSKSSTALGAPYGGHLTVETISKYKLPKFKSFVSAQDEESY